MAKLVIFSSGFPSAPPPSTLAEPTALTKMRTISHREPGPRALSFFSREMLKHLPGSTSWERLESRSSDIQLSSWELWDEAGKGVAIWRAAAPSKAKQLVLASEIWFSNPLGFSALFQPALDYREGNENYVYF